jgi:adenylate kinase
VNLIFLGPPGAGKGTQAQRVAEVYAIPQVATGDILKKARRERSPLGLRAQQYLDKGLLVPDDVVVGIVGERLAMPDSARGFVLDGFPRTVPQADALGQMLEKMHRKIDHVLLFDLERSELLKRLVGRWTCPNDGSTYHLIFNPPRNPGICDKDNAELYQREDDKEETIRERLRVYHEQTEPLVEYYRRQGLLRPISALGSVDAIFERIAKTIGDSGKK